MTAADRVTIRNQRLSDARGFFRILQEGRFKYFLDPPKTIELEREFLEKSISRRKAGTEYNFSILYDGKLAGAVGIHPDERFGPHCCEIGYFVDRKLWGRGIATQAVGLAEAFALEKFKPERFELYIIPGNSASKEVALKCGYEPEGLLRKKLRHGDRLEDAQVFAKIP